MLRAGPSFSVQVKSSPGPLTYETDAAREWISNQQNPFLVCIVDRATATCEIYSTWNMRNGHLSWGSKRTVLHPSGSLGDFGTPDLAGETIHARLGPPVLRLTPSDVLDRAHAMEWANILKPWIEFDRENLVYSDASMFWVRGPRWWETNRRLPMDQPWFEAFYWNPNNLPGCFTNFVRSAVALRRVIDAREDGGHEVPAALPVGALDDVLRAFGDYLDPMARQVLDQRTASREVSRGDNDVA